LNTIGITFWIISAGANMNDIDTAACTRINFRLVARNHVYRAATYSA
jgi:hypothetical protein